MNEKRSEDLTRQERTAFGSLSETASPSAEVEDRVVSALAERGLVRLEPWWLRVYRWVPPAPRMAMAAVSVLIAFVVGVEYGKRSAEVPATGTEGIPEVRLDEPTEEEKTVEDPGGTMVAYEEDDTWTSRAGMKPDLASLDNGGHGAFPPFPLEGRDVSISPKYR